MRKSLTMLLVAVFILTGSIAVNAFAGGMGKGCHNSGMTGKIYHKIKFLMENQEELGLTDAQLEKIKALKFAMKRDLVKREADIDMVAIDIKEKLYEDTIDVGAVDKLIDQKYDLKKAKAKALVAEYADLKNILTEDQKEKAKLLWYQGCSR